MNPLPTEAFYDLTDISDVTLSPAGDRAAFVAEEFDPEADERLSSLFVVPTDGSRDPHRLTRVASASAPRWSPSGDRLAFLAAREEDTGRRVGRDADDGDDANGEGDGVDGDGGDDADEDEEPKTQVWAFDLALGGDARQVTDFEEGASEFDWSPDGDRMVVAARDPTDEQREYLEDRRDGGPVETERLQHKLDGVGYLDAVTTYLFVVDAETGESERLDDARGGGAYQDLVGLTPAWGPSDRIAYSAYEGDAGDDTFVRDVYSVRPNGSDKRRHTGGDLTATLPRWSPAGDRLAFVGGDPENWCIPRQMYVVERGDGAGSEGDGEGDGEGDDAEAEPRSVSASLDRTLARGAEPVWADDDTLYTLVGDEGNTRPVRLSADEDDPERTFPAQGDDRSCVALDIIENAAAARLSHPSEGDDLYAFDLDAIDGSDDANPTRLTDLNAEIRDEYEMPQVRRVAYDSDGAAVSGIVYAPPSFEFDAAADDGDGDEPLPLVVAIHGGPVAYDHPEFRFDHAAFTTRGYLVFRPNYRGGSSYGRAFAESLRGEWGTVEVDDIAAGARELVSRGWADGDRIFGHGFSYGGIAQGYLVTQHPGLFAAAAPEHGIYDLRSAYGTDDSHVWFENDYGVPWENAEAYEASSAITDIGNLRTPLLVVAGGEDWRCPPSQSEQLYVSAKKRGVDARFVCYPEEHHNIGDPDRAIHRLDEILAWYERHDPVRGTEDAGEGDDAEVDE